MTFRSADPIPVGDSDIDLELKLPSLPEVSLQDLCRVTAREDIKKLLADLNSSRCSAKSGQLELSCRIGVIKAYLLGNTRLSVIEADATARNIVVTYPHSIFDQFNLAVAKVRCVNGDSTCAEEIFPGSCPQPLDNKPAARTAPSRSPVPSLNDYPEFKAFWDAAKNAATDLGQRVAQSGLREWLEGQLRDPENSSRLGGAATAYNELVAMISEGIRKGMISRNIVDRILEGITREPRPGPPWEEIDPNAVGARKETKGTSKGPRTFYYPNIRLYDSETFEFTRQFVSKNEAGGNTPEENYGQKNIREPDGSVSFGAWQFNSGPPGSRDSELFRVLEQYKNLANALDAESKTSESRRQALAAQGVFVLYDAWNRRTLRNPAMFTDALYRHHEDPMFGLAQEMRFVEIYRKSLKLARSRRLQNIDEGIESDGSGRLPGRLVVAYVTDTYVNSGPKRANQLITDALAIRRRSGGNRSFLSCLIQARFDHLSQLYVKQTELDDRRTYAGVIDARVSKIVDQAESATVPDGETKLDRTEAQQLRNAVQELFRKHPRPK